MPQAANRRSQRTNIYDVAEYAGVSHMTVSRVLNGYSYIRESTRVRVLRAIEELNYTPSPIARALATRHARRIGVLIDVPVQNDANQVLHAFQTASREVGYTVSAFSFGHDHAPQMDSVLEELAAQGLDAICVFAHRESSLNLLRQHSLALPTLIIKGRADDTWQTVDVDQREGARLAVQHLIDRGHRTIAHLTGPTDWFDARERAQGWRKCLTEASLPEGPIIVGDWTSSFGFEVGRSFDLGNTTAVFAANDQIALGVIHGLHERGVRVPNDVSIVGFDDLPDAQHFIPPLTTVRQNFVEIGEVALRQLVTAIHGDKEPRRATIRPELVVRESTR